MRVFSPEGSRQEAYVLRARNAPRSTRVFPRVGSLPEVYVLRARNAPKGTRVFPRVGSLPEAYVLRATRWSTASDARSREDSPSRRVISRWGVAN
jgi:hypothetical protein